MTEEPPSWWDIAKNVAFVVGIVLFALVCLRSFIVSMRIMDEHEDANDPSRQAMDLGRP